MILTFTITESPYGKGTARGSKGRARPYTPAKTVTYEGRVKAACSEAMRRQRVPMFRDSVEMFIVARLMPPKATSKVKRAAMLAGEIRPRRKPDCSNIAKAVEDALNKVAYPDDALIADLHVSRVYADHEGVDVTIRPTEKPGEGS